MDSLEFERQIKRDPDVQEVLDEIAADLRLHLSESEPDHFGTGFEPFYPLIATSLLSGSVVLWGWLRSRGEIDPTRQHVELVERLIQNGTPPETAGQIVTSVLRTVQKRPADDPALRKLGGLMEKAAQDDGAPEPPVKPTPGKRAKKAPGESGG